MPRTAHALPAIDLKARHRAATCAALLTAAVALSGCGGGFVMEKLDADPTIVTSSVPQETGAADPIRRSDEATIRNAVSSADLEGAAATPLAWANADTGSRGTITQMTESKAEGRLCRSFTTSRESFNGVALYSGEACLISGGWRMAPLDPL